MPWPPSALPRFYKSPATVEFPRKFPDMLNQPALLRGLIGAIVLIRNDPFGDKSRKRLRFDTHVSLH